MGRARNVRVDHEGVGDVDDGSLDGPGKCLRRVVHHPLIELVIAGDHDRQ